MNHLLLSVVYAFALWLGIYLLARDHHRREMRFAGIGLIAYALGLMIAVIIPNFAAYPLLALIPVICWVAALIGLWRSHQTDAGEDDAPFPLGMWVISTILFAMGVTFLVIPQNWLRLDIVLILIGADLLILGYRIAALSAREDGESLLPDALRSLANAALWVAIVGGQVLLMMRLTNAQLELTPLLFGVISAVIILQSASDSINRGVDSVFLRRNTKNPAHERDELRAVYNAISRRDEQINPATLDARELTRLTRRALSNLGDLERLAASPLIYLPLVGDQLAAKGLADNTLNRVQTLRRILIAHIDRLKPLSGTYGISEEWRYFNVIYYPYVLGMKPNRMDDIESADVPHLSDIREWFRAQVPERTLHNWQTKAAQIIARDLLESP